MINRIFATEQESPPGVPQPESLLPVTKPAAAEAIERWIGDHPVVCVSVAALTGVVIGCLLKRR